MEEIVLTTLQNNNKDKLAQILHHKIEFQQIKYALGQEDFNNFINSFQFICLEKTDKIQIVTGNMYYFLVGGHIVKKIEKQKNQKNKLMSANRKMAISIQSRQTNILQPVQKGQISKIQDLLTPDKKHLGYYQPHQQPLKLLSLSQSNLSSQILQKLRTYITQKLKFLNKLPLFSQIPRNILQQNIQKFHFMKIYFNDIIYSKQLRNNYMFVLMKGEVIVESGVANKNKSIIVRPPSILADEKESGSQRGKCATQYCVCFGIQRGDLEGIFRKKAEIDEKEFQGMAKTLSIGMLRAGYFRGCQINSENLTGIRYSQTQDTSLCTISSHPPSQPIPKPRQKPHPQQTLLQKSHKNARIKQHFSNFLNQKYKKYQSKLQKSLQTTKQTPILYQIKSLSPSAPDYHKINQKLRQQRIKKILQPKQINKKSQSSETLMKCMEEGKGRKGSFVLENDCIRDKILRSIEVKIKRQIFMKNGGRVKLV